MPNQPLISVIIPVYNTEKYISDCLNSLVSQTEKNIEILAVDDGSTDNSLKILQQYAALHSNIKVFSQKNAGPGVARNLALRKAKGKYIMFCDSDDISMRAAMPLCACAPDGLRLRASLTPSLPVPRGACR